MLVGSKSGKTILECWQCQILMREVDEHHFTCMLANRLPCNGDFKTFISKHQLEDLVGHTTSLGTIFPFCDRICLRRTEARGKCINFHVDEPCIKQVMEIFLNGSSDFVGGLPVFATQDIGFVAPSRMEAGSYTIRNRGLLHGVTALAQGVRYSLILLRLDTK